MRGYNFYAFEITTAFWACRKLKLKSLVESCLPQEQHKTDDRNSTNKRK